MVKEMGKRDWVKSVREKLPDHLGDCPTLPQEMLDLLTGSRAEKSGGVWGETTFNRHARGSSPAWRVARAG
jgi:hypothetical protein